MSRTLAALTQWLNEPTYRKAYDPDGPERAERQRRVEAVRKLNTHFGVKNAAEAMTKMGLYGAYEDLMINWKEQPVDTAMTLDSFAAGLKAEDEAVTKQFEKSAQAISELIAKALDAGHDAILIASIVAASNGRQRPVKVDRSAMIEALKRRYPDAFSFAQAADSLKVKPEDMETARKIPINASEEPRMDACGGKTEELKQDIFPDGAMSDGPNRGVTE